MKRIKQIKATLNIINLLVFFCLCLCFNVLFFKIINEE